jgi:hypothetical protein
MSKYIAKAIKFIDNSFTTGNNYICEDIGGLYIITDNYGSKHNICKCGELIKRFEIREG